jgi:hypothetical protein
MNNDFKATHVIVATSYEDAEKYGLGVGAEVIEDQYYESKNWWTNELGYSVRKGDATVVVIEDYKANYKPASLFTEAQLRELEGLYGLVATGKLADPSGDARPATRVVACATEPVKSYYLLSRGEQPVGLFFTSEDATIAAEDVCDPYLDVFDEKGLHFGTMKMIDGQWSQNF